MFESVQLDFAKGVAKRDRTEYLLIHDDSRHLWAQIFDRYDDDVYEIDSTGFDPLDPDPDGLLGTGAVTGAFVMETTMAFGTFAVLARDNLHKTVIRCELGPNGQGAIIKQGVWECFQNDVVWPDDGFPLVAREYAKLCFSCQNAEVLSEFKWHLTDIPALRGQSTRMVERAMRDCFLDLFVLTLQGDRTVEQRRRRWERRDIFDALHAIVANIVADYEGEFERRRVEFIRKEGRRQNRL